MWFQVFQFCQGLLYCPGCGLFWMWAFHGNLKMLYILLLCGVFYKCQLDTVSWWCCSAFLYCVIFYFAVLSVEERAYVFSKYSWIGLLFLSVLTVFASYILQLCCLVESHISSCVLGGSILFSLLIVFSVYDIFALKSNLLNINKATPTFYWCLHGIYFPSFYFHTISLHWKWISCRQHLVGSCFQSILHSLFFSSYIYMPFIFNVIIYLLGHKFTLLFSLLLCSNFCFIPVGYMNFIFFLDLVFWFICSVWSVFLCTASFSACSTYFTYMYTKPQFTGIIILKVFVKCRNLI